MAVVSTVLPGRHRPKGAEQTAPARARSRVEIASLMQCTFHPAEQYLLAYRGADGEGEAVAFPENRIGWGRYPLRVRM